MGDHLSKCKSEGHPKVGGGVPGIFEVKPRRGQDSQLLFRLLCGPHGKARLGCHRHFVQDRFGCLGLQWVNSQKYFNLLKTTLWGKVAFLAFRVH